MPFFKKDNLTIFFSHIPKTGGSSVEEFFEKNGFTITFISKIIYPCSLQHLQYGHPKLMEKIENENIEYSFTIII